MGLEPGRVLGQVHRAPAGQHRAERTRITVGDPDPALCAIVALQQGEQALAAAGEYVAGGHPGRLHERGVTRLLRRLPALDLRLLPDRTDDVERDLHRPVALFPVDLRDLDPGRPVPAAPLEHRLVEVPADPRVIDEPLQFPRGVPAGPAGVPLDPASLGIARGATSARSRRGRRHRRPRGDVLHRCAHRARPPGHTQVRDARPGLAQLSGPERPVVGGGDLGRQLPVRLNQRGDRTDPARPGLVQVVGVQQRPQRQELGQEVVAGIQLLLAVRLGELAPPRRCRHDPPPPARCVAARPAPAAAAEPTRAHGCRRCAAGAPTAPPSW